MRYSVTQRKFGFKSGICTSVSFERLRTTLTKDVTDQRDKEDIHALMYLIQYSRVCHRSRQ
jgi:hypothetical protein